MTVDLESAEAEKYAAELTVIKNLADNFLLPDAEAIAGAEFGSHGIGFAQSLAGTITFATIGAKEEGKYRGAPAEHATRVADLINTGIIAKTSQGVINLVGKPIAKVEGSKVTVDLSGLRKLLSQHAIADDVAEIGKSYSFGYMKEKANKVSDEMLNGLKQGYAQRDMQKRAEAAEARIVAGCKQVLDDPESIQAIREQDPELAENISGTLKNVTQVAAGIAQAPEDKREQALEQVRQQGGEGFAELVQLALPQVQRVLEEIKRQQAGRPEAETAPAAEAAGPAAQRVKESRQAGGAAQGRS